MWDNKSSVLVGDFLFSRSFELMVEDGSLDVLAILSRASSVIAEGEVLQMMTANDTETGEDDYLEVIRAKTAKLFAAAAEIGAVVAERPMAEREALRSWLSRGNHALVLAAAGDAPRWMATSDGSSSHDFLESFDFVLAMRRDDEDDEQVAEKSGERKEEGTSPLPADLETWLAGESVELLPRFRHPLTRDVVSVSAHSAGRLDRGWYLTGANHGRVVLPLLAEVENGAAFWEARVGSGRLWVSRYSDLFANTGLGEADNARFVANLVAWALGPNGRVIFDDMHQGVTDIYDAKAFFSDPRFVSTMMFMVGFWLLYLVGRSRRLAPAREAVSHYYAADLARAMAGFFARRLSAVTTERQLFAFFFNDIRSRYGLPTNGQPVWSMLSGMSRVSADDINGLRTHYERAAAGRKPNLVAVARLMRRTRDSLL